MLYTLPALLSISAFIYLRNHFKKMVKKIDSKEIHLPRPELFYKKPVNINFEIDLCQVRVNEKICLNENEYKNEWVK